jgi:hypothetical protein
VSVRGFLWRYLLPPSHTQKFTETVWWTANTGGDELHEKPPTPPMQTEDERKQEEVIKCPECGMHNSLYLPFTSCPRCDWSAWW